MRSVDTSALSAISDVRTRRLIERATQLIVARCMESQGFEYQLPADRSTDIPAPSVIVLQVLGLQDAQQASQRGYLQPTDDDRAVLEPTATQGAAYRRALFGDETAERELDDLVDAVSGATIGLIERRHGCVGAAESEVYRIDGVDVRARYFSLDAGLQQAAVDIVSQAMSAPEVTASMKRWSTCMHDQGYNYASLDDGAIVQWPEPRPGPIEIASAVADVSCKETSGVRSAFVAALTTATAAKDAELASLLAEWQELRSGLSAAAAATIGRATPGPVASG